MSVSHRDQALEILENLKGNTSKFALEAYDRPKNFVLYLLQLAGETLKSKQRRTRRREIRAEIKPQFVRGKVTGSYVLTKQSKERIFRNTQELFGANGWKIGNLQLGAWTKERLIDEAARERSSAKGHIQNACFYEALAEPLKSGQRVDAYWSQEDGTKLKQSIWKKTESHTPALVN
jgi:hypothetical protein